MCNSIGQLLSNPLLPSPKNIDEIGNFFLCCYLLIGRENGLQETEAIQCLAQVFVKLITFYLSDLHILTYNISCWIMIII